MKPDELHILLAGSNNPVVRSKTLPAGDLQGQARDATSSVWGWSYFLLLYQSQFNHNCVAVTDPPRLTGRFLVPADIIQRAAALSSPDPSKPSTAPSKHPLGSSKVSCYNFMSWTGWCSSCHTVSEIGLDYSPHDMQCLFDGHDATQLFELRNGA